MRPRRPNAFASVLAIAMIAMLSTTLTLMMWRARSVTLDLRTVRREAQLRELLTSGAAASADLASGDHETADLVLPEPLHDRASVTLRIIPSEFDLVRIIRVDARLDTRQASQTLRYGKTNRGWALLGAQLGDEPGMD